MSGTHGTKGTNGLGGHAGVTQREYGVLADGRTVHEYTLDNGAGMTLGAINLGGIVTALRVPDRAGVARNVVLGLPSLADYERRNPNFGVIVGRYANRIAGGRFELDGATVELARNEGPNTLHGGPGGFGKRWWDIAVQPVADDGSVSIELQHRSDDGDQGFPGRLEVSVRYTLTPQNVWRIDYRAHCDRTTVVNLSHHDYFNLSGSGSILGHRLTIAASRYCPVDPGLIPQGVADVAGTPFDFREPHRIGERIRAGHAQLLAAKGYDHNWVLDGAGEAAAREGAMPIFAARLEDPDSGLAMDIETTEPGLQFYSGNLLDASLMGSGGEAYRQGDGVCLETQHFPDSPNHPQFPSTVLRPGEVYASTTVHRFGRVAPPSTANERTS